jgi:hypothetical protein
MLLNPVIRIEMLKLANQVTKIESTVKKMGLYNYFGFDCSNPT